MQPLRSLSSLALFLLCLNTSLHARHPVDFDTHLERIAFGSCNRTDLPQPLWPIIQRNQPNLWIWMGDNIYGDSTQATVLAAKYQAQLANSAYQQFAAHTPIIGTWDDHDYGWNNAGREYPTKAASRELALNFFGVPQNDPRWQHPGIYGSYQFGPHRQAVKIILLDCRSFAHSQDLLGSTQRDWLLEELKNSTAQLNILVSSIQVLPTEHRFEKWANFGDSRAWLLKQINELQPLNLLILSGDRHLHEISAHPQQPHHSGPLVEITSSGLTHAYKRFKGEANSLRIGTVYPGIGFGLLELDWQQAKLIVTASIRNPENKSMQTHQITYPLQQNDSALR